jgi:anionic cell wall polymer biosynthesis LytR-Cps2A-Psr (LCP) family protein
MKKTLKWIAIILLTILVLVMLAGMYKFNYLASQEGYDCDGNKIEKSMELSIKQNSLKSAK